MKIENQSENNFLLWIRLSTPLIIPLKKFPTNQECVQIRRGVNRENINSLQTLINVGFVMKSGKY